MIHPDIIDKQLKQIGADFRFWGRGEVRELPHILMEGEKLQVVVMGRYHGGFAMLATTDQRILLIDKKPMYLTLEDIRYDMVAEVDYRQQLIDSTVNICTLNKQLRFTSSRKPDLRQLTNFVQQRVSELRRHTQFMNTLVAEQPQGFVTNPYANTPLIMKQRISTFGSSRS